MSTMTESIGRVLARRYRIESVLGTGASAHVFCAWDVTLRRRVAIKLLHPAMASDGAFLRRFRAEAQSAAALAHPHVLSVFDWGEDASGPFLVLEFLRGGSLRDVLDGGEGGHVLSVSQAVSIGIQAADGLAYAHGRGFVHRDIKPANLLFDEEGRLRIADFGLARALAEAALTEPSGATVGTARYAAPEQALGNLVDGRADVYSLALVLYEAVTGVVPFTADTTISTLMARVGAQLPPHDALGPLAAVLEEAAAPEAEERLDAQALSGRLHRLAGGLPAPARLPLVLSPLSNGGGDPDHANPNGPRAVGSAAAISDIDRTEHGMTLGSSTRTGRLDAEPDGTLAGLGGAPSTQVREGSPAGPRQGEPDDDSYVSQLLAVASAVGVATQADDVDSKRVADEREPAAVQAPVVRAPARFRRLRRPWRFVSLSWRTVLIVLLVALVVGGAAFAVVQTKVFVPSHRVPNLENLTTAEAAGTLRPDHLGVKVIRDRFSTTVARGGVVRQLPAPGSSLKEGETVSLVISTGPPPVPVPSLTSITDDCPAVAAALASAHLHPDCTYRYDLQVPKGTVIDWSPTGRAPEFSAVKVVISQGPPIETIPSLTGMSCAAATSALQGAGLVAKCVNAYTTSGTPVGQVIPGAWRPSTSAPEGSTVTVQISQGPPLVQVPAVVPNMTVTQEVAALQAANLASGQLYGPLSGTVFATNPSFPATVPEGTVVNIYTH